MATKGSNKILINRNFRNKNEKRKLLNTRKFTRIERYISTVKGPADCSAQTMLRNPHKSTSLKFQNTVNKGNDPKSCRGGKRYNRDLSCHHTYTIASGFSHQ